MALKLKDTFYISHGSPTLSIDESFVARKFLQSWKKDVYEEKPKSILVISGHWDTTVPTVNVIQTTNDTICDFNGFPKPMYQLKYPAPGAPHLAKRVKELLNKSGFNRVNDDKKRGLDHGAWVPLMLMYPEADIPVCQLSVQSNLDGTYHYNIGKALAPLKNEEYMVLTSFENRFANATSRLMVSTHPRYEDVNHYEQKAPHARKAHPNPDHFFPLHVAIGAAGENSKAKLIHSSIEMSTISYASYQFTSDSS
ncbi:hypothetical protein TSUD_294660 [Trifolium subterraneum]|uniref:Extradiol ring-cleavage dioxygenase class III enzyme subunit B domain-containing protein n=1 Tax=Trifolium subterraneum TaxID=3900 RepID=A0A2Z6MEK7_TRISU|nr:hypothetical protein TSUD_294660 [Trifolium subterraneum]